MRFYQREIIVSILALLITSVAIGYFIRGVTDEKQGTQTELFLLSDSAPSALLLVNKPATFNRMMLAQEETKQLFIPFVPEIFLDIIGCTPSLESVLFSFYGDEVVMYAKAQERTIRHLNRELQRRFPIYTPHQQEKEGIEYIFYPDTANRYLGCYYYANVWVASYSKHRLEQVAHRQRQGTTQSNPTLTRMLQSLDRQAPLNLICPAQPLNLYVAINDSSQWRLNGEWLAADIFSDHKRLCCIGNITYRLQADSLYHSLADTLNCRLQQLFPNLHIQSHADVDQELVYFTSCGTPTEP